MTLWLVRHAQPLIEPGICYGALDVAADVHATRQCAHALAAALPINCLVTASPLQRCEQLTLTLQGLRPDLVYKADLRLREINFGCWEGRHWDDIGAAALDAWVNDFAQHSPGGGESVQQFMQRVSALWDETRAVSSLENKVWITHAGVIRAATLLHQGIRHITHANQWPAATAAFGEWVVLA